jgi:hypothetical protein
MGYLVTPVFSGSKGSSCGFPAQQASFQYSYSIELILEEQQNLLRVWLLGSYENVTPAVPCDILWHSVGYFLWRRLVAFPCACPTVAHSLLPSKFLPNPNSRNYISFYKKNKTWKTSPFLCFAGKMHFSCINIKPCKRINPDYFIQYVR